MNQLKEKRIFAEYIDHMGSDLLVVNAARASFGKESTWEPGSILEEDGGRKLRAGDASLIRFLATGYRTKEWDEFLDQIREAVINGASGDLEAALKSYKRKAQHWAPFAHPHCTIRINIPIFLARQFVKHQTGGVWSEESRRYISEEPGVWFPDEWHSRPEDVKQGAGALVEDQDVVAMIARTSTLMSVTDYGALLDMGVAPEEARIVLSLNTMTTVVWTGSLLFWSRVANQRVDPHAQLAAQELGRKIAAIMRPLYPVSWAELCD